MRWRLWRSPTLKSFDVFKEFGQIIRRTAESAHSDLHISEDQTLFLRLHTSYLERLERIQQGTAIECRIVGEDRVRFIGGSGG